MVPIVFGSIMKSLPSFLKTIFFTLISCLLIANVTAQGWEKIFEQGWEGKDVKQTTDSGYIVVGTTFSLGAGWSDIYLIKLNSIGDILWAKTYGGTDIEEGGSVQQTTDGGYILVGYTTSFGAGGKDVYLIKTNANGDTLWTKTYGGSTDEEVNSVQQTTDGGYILAGYDRSFTIYGGNPYELYLIKIDANGIQQWFTTTNEWYGGGFMGSSVLQTTDGGYITASKEYWSGGNTGIRIRLTKTDGNGIFQWNKIYEDAWPSSIKPTDDGGYIVSGFHSDSSADMYLLKVDANGDSLWTRTFGDSNHDEANSAQQTNDGGYVITGLSDATFSWDTSNIKLIKTDASGNLLWKRTFKSEIGNIGYSVQQTFDKGYIITGATRAFNSVNYMYTGGLIVIKTDSLGNWTNVISGNVFHDKNGNCIKDGGEENLKQQLLKVTPGPVYTQTDTAGNYTFLVQQGTYTVNLVPSNNWKQSCPSSPATYTYTYTTLGDTSANDNFADTVSVYCPHLWVDISTTLVRKCRTNIYTVNYCNNGTDTAFNAYTEVKFDTAFIVLSSTPIAWSSVSGNTYTFNLGNLAPGQCGSFYITDSVSCNAVLNSALCVQAIIYPDTLCTPPDSVWDNSSISVTGKCVNDSLACFTIYNNGQSMTGTSQYRIYVNNMLVLTQSFQLNAGDSLTVCYPANGNTIRFEADQRPGHPGNSHPKSIIEACGTPSVYGNVTNVPQDDGDDNVDIDCETVKASSDPNEKSVQPEGITSGKYISASDELEYHINFQNTGNDTAFIVVVRDTLSPYLAPETVVSGVSSHPYSFRIYGQGILEWTFNNILLPDSTVNEAASHGFIKFNVKQKANNPKGSTIENTAAIYFDYNAPVITNKVWNMVYDTTILGIGKPIIYDNHYDIKVYPNPFSTSTTLVIASGAKQSLEYIQIILYDVLGGKIEIASQKFAITANGKAEIKIDRRNLQSGMYFYKLTNEGGIIGSGKFVIQ